jgi:signal peptide peptidase SppA
MQPPSLNRFLSEPAFIEAGAAMSLLLGGQPEELLYDGSGGVIGARIRGREIEAAEHPIFSKLKGDMRPKAIDAGGGVAIVPIEGVLARKPSLFEMLDGVEDSANLLDLFNATVSNPEVNAVLLDMDSPGGFITGGPELADAVRNSPKPVHVWTGGTMASLAYWVGSQGAQVTASRSSRVGSIGAYVVNRDYSKLFENAGVKVEVIKNSEADFKAAGVPGTSLTEDQRTQLQKGVQASFDEFKAAILSARPGVKAEAMKGQTFSGNEAVKLGLIDGITDTRAGAVALLKRSLGK